MTGVNATTRLPALDGMRGIAVLLVVASHCFVNRYSMAGPVGVSVFYALSGFLIASLLLLERDHAGIGPAAFYLRRARRLLPALVVLIAALLAVGAVAWRTALPPLLYVQNLAYLQRGASTPLNHTWSLAIEEQFYLAFPLSLLLLRRLSDRQLLAVYTVAALASAAWRLSMVDHAVSAYYGTGTNACLLLVGVCAALAVRIWQK
jgi:peptidoglycan/LPS O-acetylase OafA/YrhL